jgi:hypothetical protein
MENRSFDNVLGHLRHPDEGNRPEVEGIEDFQNDRYMNKNTDGLGIRPELAPIRWTPGLCRQRIIAQVGLGLVGGSVVVV